MAKETHLDNLIQFKATVASALSNSQKVAGLILNDPDVDMESEPVMDLLDTNIYQYDYLDDTVERGDAFIMVDCDMVRRPSSSIMECEVYVQVVCGKSYMKLKPSVFPGVQGTRLDNLVRQIDMLLNESREFGIGRLELKSVITAATPPKFSSKLITYSTPDFAKVRRGT